MKRNEQSLVLLKEAIYQGISDEKSVMEYALKIAKFEKHKIIEAPDMAEAIQYRFEEKAEDGMYCVNSVFYNYLFDKNKKLEMRRRRISLDITKKMNLKIEGIYDEIKRMIFEYFNVDTREFLKQYIEMQMNRNLTIKDLEKIYKVIRNINIFGNEKIQIEDLAFAIQKYGLK